jgi:hypothetical protein
MVWVPGLSLVGDFLVEVGRTGVRTPRWPWLLATLLGVAVGLAPGGSYDR